MNNLLVDVQYVEKKRKKIPPPPAMPAQMCAKTFGMLYKDVGSERQPGASVIKSKFRITKTNDEKKQCFGWALVSHEWAEDDNGDKVLKQLVDYQKDMIEEPDLEDMAYKFVLKYREEGSDHERGGQGECIESMVFTLQKQQALGIAPGTLPIGWWIGFQVTDDVLWDGIKKGKYKDFSIEGTATRTPVTIDDKTGQYSIAKGGGESS